MIAYQQDPSHLDIMYQSLQELGNLSIYELLSGVVTDYNITYPAFYITNITNSSVNATVIEQTIDSYVSILENTVFTKDPFVGGVVAFCFVICGIVTASWMLLMLLMFSSNSVPNSLLLITFYSCCTYTVIVSRLTGILHYQISSNFTNIDEINNIISYSRDIIIVRSVLYLLNYISWVDLLVQMNRFHNRRKASIIGLCVCFFAFAVHTTYNLLYHYLNSDARATSKVYRTFKYAHWIIDYMILITFTLEVILYAQKRLRFVFHSKTLPLTIFCSLTLATPFVFLSLDISSKLMKNWANYVFAFSNLCCSIVVWEWLHAVRTLEVKYERKTVLGRQISKDSFARESRYKPLGSRKRKQIHNNDAEVTNSSSSSISHSYILKSTNFLNFIDVISRVKSSINEGFKKHILRKNAAVQRDTPNAGQDDDDDVSLYEMSSLNANITNLSNVSHMSAEEDDNHPQFEIDQRYLRNTPSTVANSTARNTPVAVNGDLHEQSHGE
ncbi:hypothetical protein WICPIJ_001114 [Wickerhamomyces pijperi]|uniref:PH-response regulator protein palH/RIM21 n=1 Tax=Wickerhamomyces pijperi TaxID=599730 RepID=A0A9P8QEC6_WICPI|nr:hypothetical protein WICPIJ_001114 [Wickerhamomyces pijperi]